MRLLLWVTWVLYKFCLRYTDLTGVALREMYEAVEEQAPLPGDIEIVPNPHDPLAPFLGHWFGRWTGILASQFVVEKVGPEEAQLVYSHGDFPMFGFSKSWSRETAKLRDGKYIVFGEDVLFEFHLDESKRHVMGVRRTKLGDQCIAMSRRSDVLEGRDRP
ncbi:MAG: hypothetical protein ACYTFG_00930 [Planctomycetota bacterium]|jgi:hypothetical protein